MLINTIKTCLLGGQKFISRQCFLHSCAFSSTSSVVHPAASTCPSYLSGSDAETVEIIKNSFILYENFISEEEESCLIREIEPIFKRRRYERDHWDDAIQGYKETEKVEWSTENEKILTRLRELVFPPHIKQIEHVHVLDLAKNGFIKPHVDSIRFCGDTIAGLSLISSSVMRLVRENNKANIVDVLLPRRSLYVMKGEARLHFTHEILEDKSSYFKGTHVPRERRISVICRNKVDVAD